MIRYALAVVILVAAAALAHGKELTKFEKYLKEKHGRLPPTKSDDQKEDFESVDEINDAFADEKFKMCCDTCIKDKCARDLGICYYNITIAHAQKVKKCGKRIPTFKGFIKCAVDDVDTTECCKRKGVGFKKQCLDLCQRGGPKTLGAKHLKCGPVFHLAMQCNREAVRKGEPVKCALSKREEQIKLRKMRQEEKARRRNSSRGKSKKRGSQ